MIAHALAISPETVRHYIKRIYRELDVYNRADVVRVALETPGLLTLQNVPDASADNEAVIGRDADLSEIKSRLDQSKFVCIVGMGGIGKTSVAQLLAQQLNARDQPATWIDLRNTTDGDSLFFQIGQALGCEHGSGAGSVFDALLRHVAETKGVLILDNFEQLAGEAAHLDALLEGAPALSIVVTSRVELQSTRAVHYPLSGLRANAASTDMPTPAATLFQRTCRQVAPHISFDAPIAQIANQICDKLGGSPLAIKLAGSWLDTLSMDQMLDALETGSDILASPRVDRSDHGNMDGVFRATLEFRPAQERDTLRKLAVFAGPFDTSAASAIADCTAASLATFVRAALVQTEPGPDAAYSLHPLMRETLRAEFEATAEYHQTLDRFCAYFLGPLMREADLSDTECRPLASYPCRGNNLLRAWDTSIRQQDFAIAVASAPQLAEQMLLAGRGAEALAKLDAGIKALTHSAPPDRAKHELDLRLALVPIFMTARGHSATETGQNARQTVELARALDDKGKLFRALWSLARFEMVRQENSQRILSLAKECHGVSNETGQNHDRLLSENLLGGAYFFAGDFVAAERHLGASAAIYDPDQHRQLRRVLGQDIGALSHIQHSWTLFYLGRDEDALRAARRAEALTFRLGDDASRGWYLVNASCLHFLRWDFERVHALASEGLAAARDAEIEQMISGLCLLNGGARIMLGDTDAGMRELDEGMELRRKHGLGPVTSWVADLLCTCQLRLGNKDEAERIVRFGIDHAEASGCGPSHSELERHLGQILEDRGDIERAGAAYQRALDIADRQGAKSLSLCTITSQLALLDRTGQSGSTLNTLASRITGDLQSVDTKEAIAARQRTHSYH